MALSRWAGTGAIVGWGLLQWDYGERSLHAQSEGWFQQDTKEGGADKLGHFYSSYVLSHAFGALYRHWGLETDRAAREAMLASLLVTGAMEIGDGFSPYGISWEDMVMNAAGAWTGYALQRSPVWRERLDLRMEYRFNTDNHDPFTDYGHGRFLVALKFDGFAALCSTPLRWFELQGGYYARGYDDPATSNRRVGYIGLGLNFPALFRRMGMPKVATTLQFYQIPGTTLRMDEEL